MEEKKLKRRRLNGTHRWSDTDALHLVQQVSKEVKDKQESFEKPTAQIFYKKISAKSAVLKDLGWVPMKNKMRHLKTSYLSALNWRSQTGAGLLAEGNEQSVKHYIEKICPQWNYLQQIFGQSRGVNPSFILKTSSDTIDSNNGLEENSFLGYLNDESTPEMVEPVVVGSSESSPDIELTDSQSSPYSIPLQSTIKNLQQTTSKSKHVSPFSLLLSLQEQKLEIEIKKFQMEKEIAVNKLELKKFKMEQEFEIKKLQLESKERIKKYEIEKKYKSLSE